MAKLPKRVRVSFQPDLRVWAVVALDGTRAGRLVDYYGIVALADVTFKARHDGKGQRCWVEGEWLPGLNDWQSDHEHIPGAVSLKAPWCHPLGQPNLRVTQARLVLLEVEDDGRPWVGAKGLRCSLWVDFQGEPVA
jgi:hypothetical protein